MQCSSANQAHPPGNCTFPHSTCSHASRSAAFFPVFMLLLFKFAISNSPKIGNLALTFPIACGKLINADEAACLISLDADIAQLVERLIRNHQVKGSSPFIGSIFYRGVAQFGSAFGSGPKGRRFKSCHLDQKSPEIERFPVLFCSIRTKHRLWRFFHATDVQPWGKDQRQGPLLGGRFG